MAANPLTVYGPAPVDQDGVLNCWVQQPTDMSPYEQTNAGIKYQEKFKGPYSIGKGILNTIKTGDKLTNVHTALSTIVSRYVTPTCPSRDNMSGEWQVEKIQVKEIGAHCELTIDCIPQYSLLNQPGTSEDPWQDVWSLSWQSYSVSPYAFCSNEEHHDQKVCNGEQYTPDWEMKAKRSHIEQFKNSQDGNFENGAGAYIYSPNKSNDRFFLNATEVEVMKKAYLGKSAIYHYPILKHQTVTSNTYSPESASAISAGVKIQYPKPLGNDLDVASSPGSDPEGCPYNFAASYQWIKIGDDMVQTKSKKKLANTFQRIETWMGVLSADANFYGSGTFQHTEEGIKNGRWEVGKL